MLQADQNHFVITGYFVISELVITGVHCMIIKKQNQILQNTMTSQLNVIAIYGNFVIQDLQLNNTMDGK